MYKPIILPLAKQDIREAADWYNTKQKGLGKRFTKAVKDKVYYICQNPEAIAIRYGTVRTAFLDIFPFLIHYSKDDRQKTILISAVFHTSRNPDLWRTR